MPNRRHPFFEEITINPDRSLPVPSPAKGSSYILLSALPYRGKALAKISCCGTYLKYKIIIPNWLLQKMNFMVIHTKAAGMCR